MILITTALRSFKSFCSCCLRPAFVLIAMSYGLLGWYRNEDSNVSPLLINSIEMTERLKIAKLCNASRLLSILKSLTLAQNHDNLIAFVTFIALLSLSLTSQTHFIIGQRTTIFRFVLSRDFIENSGCSSTLFSRQVFACFRCTHFEHFLWFVSHWLKTKTKRGKLLETDLSWPSQSNHTCS